MMRNSARGRRIGSATRRDAAEMVDVTVRVDHRDDGRVAEVLARQCDAAAAVSTRGQRVDDDPAGLAFDQRHVREIVAAHLVDAIRHLEQAVDAVQLA